MNEKGQQQAYLEAVTLQDGLELAQQVKSTLRLLDVFEGVIHKCLQTG